MNPEYIPILTTLISVAGSLIVAFGTWHISMRNERHKQMEEMRSLMDEHKEETQKTIRSLQDDITQVNSTVQTQIAIIEVKIDTLSDRVDKHNGVIERTIALEKAAALHDEKISVANHRIEDLEKKTDKTA